MSESTRPDTAAEADAAEEPTEVIPDDERQDDEHAAKLADLEARADKYARELLQARVAATGRLADPTDLPYSAEFLDDADALTAAIDALLEAKPHLASRKPAWGDVGAGQTKHSDTGPTFADLFR